MTKRPNCHRQVLPLVSCKPETNIGKLIKLFKLTNSVSPRQKNNLKGKDPSQTFIGLGPTVNLEMKIVTRILTGIIGSWSCAILSRGTPNSISFKLKMFSAAENPKLPVSMTIITR